MEAVLQCLLTKKWYKRIYCFSCFVVNYGHKDTKAPRKMLKHFIENSQLSKIMYN